MIIEKDTHDFLYRVFCVRSSSRKTYHQSGTDRKSKYIDIWHLAPRTKLVPDQDISSVFIGETLRLTYGIEEKSETIVVVRQTSSTITGILQCGKIVEVLRYIQRMRLHAVKRSMGLQCFIVY